jgi:fluoride exporter
MLKSIMIVGFGGFIGTVARFLISRYFQENVSSVFPWGTFIVNIVGCLLIGLIYGISEKGELMSPEVRLFLTVGICGGFTTFSTFSNDAFILLRQDEWLRFAFYTSLSFFLGLLAVYAGRLTTKIF